MGKPACTSAVKQPPGTSARAVAASACSAVPEVCGRLECWRDLILSDVSTYSACTYVRMDKT